MKRLKVSILGSWKEMMGDELAALILSAYNGWQDDFRPHLIGYYSKSERASRVSPAKSVYSVCSDYRIKIRNQIASITLAYCDMESPCSSDYSTSPIKSINSGSFPGNPTISTSKTIVESAGILGLPADAGLPFLPKANSLCNIHRVTSKTGEKRQAFERREPRCTWKVYLLGWSISSDRQLSSVAK